MLQQGPVLRGLGQVEWTDASPCIPHDPLQTGHRLYGAQCIALGASHTTLPEMCWYGSATPKYQHLVLATSAQQNVGVPGCNPPRARSLQAEQAVRNVAVDRFQRFDRVGDSVPARKACISLITNHFNFMMG